MAQKTSQTYSPYKFELQSATFCYSLGRKFKLLDALLFRLFYLFLDPKHNNNNGHYQQLNIKLHFTEET